MYLPQCYFFQVNDYEFSLNSIKITFFDTPGLADGTGKEEEYMRKIREKVTGICDVFIFCTDMNSTRFCNDDTKTLETLTKTFGPRLWEHALVALTLANKVYPRKNSGVTEIGYFDGRIQMFKESITKAVLKAGVSEKVVSNVPFVATGDRWDLSLPGITDWKEIFWVETFKSLNKSAQFPFFVSNCDRIIHSSSSAEKQQDPSIIALTVNSAGILLETIKGLFSQGFQIALNFLIKLCGNADALKALTQLIKNMWGIGTSKEDSKDKDEVAKEKGSTAGGYGVVKDMD